MFFLKRKNTIVFHLTGNFGPFFGLLLPSPLKSWKIKNLKIWKKHLETSSFYTSVPKLTIIWCMLPEIWRATDIIFCHFGPIFEGFEGVHWGSGYGMRNQDGLCILDFYVANKLAITNTFFHKNKSRLTTFHLEVIIHILSSSLLGEHNMKSALQNTNYLSLIWLYQ